MRRCEVQTWLRRYGESDLVSLFNVFDSAQQPPSYDVRIWHNTVDVNLCHLTLTDDTVFSRTELFSKQLAEKVLSLSTMVLCDFVVCAHLNNPLNLSYGWNSHSLVK